MSASEQAWTEMRESLEKAKAAVGLITISREDFRTAWALAIDEEPSEALERQLFGPLPFPGDTRTKPIQK